jgi:hypothetical protein
MDPQDLAACPSATGCPSVQRLQAPTSTLLPGFTMAPAVARPRRHSVPHGQFRPLGFCRPPIPSRRRSRPPSAPGPTRARMSPSFAHRSLLSLHVAPGTWACRFALRLEVRRGGRRRSCPSPSRGTPSTGSIRPPSPTEPASPPRRPSPRGLGGVCVQHPRCSLAHRRATRC